MIPRLRVFSALCLASLLGVSTYAAETSALKPFTPQSLAAIKQTQEKKPFILAFWSLHCAPCKEDMALFKTLQAKHPNLAIVLVATDGPREHAAVSRFLATQQLGRIQQWAFADEFEERVRFSVDKEWHGELPRSYLFDADHKFTAHSGVLDAKVVEAWLSRAPKAR